MKKLISSLSLILIGFYVNAQGIPNSNANSQWRISGNNASLSDYVGTNNSTGLVKI
jgi:hypothetical protein